MSIMLSEKTVKTKKPHRCFGCFGEIPVGAEASKQAWTHEGKFVSGYICMVCEIFIDSDYFDDNFDEWDKGDLFMDRTKWISFALEFQQKTGIPWNTVIQHKSVK